MTPVDQEKAAGDEQAETLRGIFHGLALAVLEVCDNLEREDDMENACPNCGRPLDDPHAPGDPCDVCGAEGT